MKTGGYLILWSTIFLVALIQADTTLPWLVKTLDPLPPAWVAMLSWLPLGCIAVAMALVKPPERGDFRPEFAAAAAIPGLIIAAQLPLAIRGKNPSADYLAASLTDTGVALSNGFRWGAGPILLWCVIYVFSRHELDKRPRAFAIGTLVASLIGLTLSVITL